MKHIYFPKKNGFKKIIQFLSVCFQGVEAQFSSRTVKRFTCSRKACACLTMAITLCPSPMPTNLGLSLCWSARGSA